MQKSRLFSSWDTHFLAGALVGRVSQRVPGRKSIFCVHGTRCRFWHCCGFFYLAFALRHVPKCLILPRTLRHTPPSSRALPAGFLVPHWPPNVETHSDRALSGVIPSLFRTCVSRDTRLLSVPPNAPCPATGKQVLATFFAPSRILLLKYLLTRIPLIARPPVLCGSYVDTQGYERKYNRLR